MERSQSEQDLVTKYIPQRPFWSFWAIGAAIVLAVCLGYLFWMGRQMAEGIASWGRPEVHLLGGAKNLILSYSPLKPSDKANVFYHYIDGFQDHTIFISYTDSPEGLTQTVKSMTGKTIDELTIFKSTKSSLPHAYVDKDAHFVYEPGYLSIKDGEKFSTPFYDLSKIVDGKFYQTSDLNENWCLIVDVAKNRLYYCKFD